MGDRQKRNVHQVSAAEASISGVIGIYVKSESWQTLEVGLPVVKAERTNYWHAKLASLA